MAYTPIHGLYLGTRLEVDNAVGEEVEHLLANLLGVVPVFEHVAGRQVVPYLVEVFHQLVAVLVGLKLLGHLGQRGGLQHIDDQHRVVGSQRTAALGDDIGMWQVVAVGGIDKGVDTVVDILLDGVVDRALARGRPCAVVVDAQSASAVDEIDVIAHFVQLDIELRSLAECRLYASDLGNLRTDVEMDEAQAVAHASPVEQIEGFEQFCTRQSELRGVAAALFPLAAARAGQLDADAYIRTHIEFLGLAGNQFQLIHLLNDNEDLLAHLLGQQGQLDVALVFIAVADDDRVALALHGDNGMQLGF